MKKNVFILIAIIAAITFSCSKDAKINRRIDGEWKIISRAGIAIPVDESYILKFNKDGKLTGNGTLTETWSTGTLTDPFTYSVSSQKIILAVDGTTEVLSVVKYEKDRLELIESGGDIWVLDPK